MKVTPKPYYICDYCKKKSDYPNFKYTDNSGLDNKCYDMCSDECKSKHIEYLNSTIPANELQKYINDWLWIVNFNKTWRNIKNVYSYL